MIFGMCLGFLIGVGLSKLVAHEDRVLATPARKRRE